MQLITPQKGSVSYEQILSRQAAGQLLTPPISERQVRRYLGILMLFSESFKNFENSQTGGLNEKQKITNWHLPELQKIRDLVLQLKTLTKVRIYLLQETEK